MKSVLAQTHPTYEIIAVDDTSPHESAEVIGRYADVREADDNVLRHPRPILPFQHDETRAPKNSTTAATTGEADERHALQNFSFSKQSLRLHLILPSPSILQELTMTIRPLAFANTLAITTAVLALVLILLRIVFPAVFVFIFNAQFFGADVASLLPERINILKMIGELIAFVGGAWGFGLLGAILYNRFIRNGQR